MNKCNGFTLIELIITVLIFSIIITLSVPAFTATLNKNQALSIANDLLADIYLARSEAIKKGIRVSICHSNDSTSCSGSWSDGWIVYQPSDNTLLSVKGKAAAGLEVIANSKIKDYISYIGTGRARSNTNRLQNGTFSIKQGDYEYKVIISNSGRPRVEFVGI